MATEEADERRLRLASLTLEGQLAEILLQLGITGGTVGRRRPLDGCIGELLAPRPRRRKRDELSDGGCSLAGISGTGTAATPALVGRTVQLNSPETSTALRVVGKCSLAGRPSQGARARLTEHMRAEHSPRLLSSTLTPASPMISIMRTPSSAPLAVSPALSNSRATLKRISQASSGCPFRTRRAVVVSAFWCAE